MNFVENNKGMDSLDRTNVVQSALAKHVLNEQLRVAGVLQAGQSVEQFEDFMSIFRNRSLLSLSPLCRRPILMGGFCWVWGISVGRSRGYDLDPLLWHRRPQNGLYPDGHEDDTGCCSGRHQLCYEIRQEQLL